jgi:hypothetical protein
VASIVRQNVGGNTYLYESVSYRNEEGKPRNRRVPIGKIDKKSGQPIYKPEYIQRMAEAGTPVESVESTPEFSVEDVRQSTILQTGLVHLLQGVADQIGLSAVLRQVFPHDHEQIFVLASFLFASGDPLSYCAEWMERSDVGELTPIASQRISEILMRITDRNGNDSSPIGTPGVVTGNTSRWTLPASPPGRSSLMILNGATIETATLLPRSTCVCSWVNSHGYRCG